ncbi:MAG: mechanosensitive ion channel [Clostridia bacterium]|nr:mechanosensitive ion channel [Clostridia bacterium]
MSFLLETTVNEPWASLLETLLSWCLGTGLKIIISLLILIISFRVINVISRKIERRAKNDNKHDKTITKVLTYIGKVGAKAIVVICLVGYLGIDTSGLTALVTSLGVCAGLAVNGALSNLAGGVLILFTRPFKIDDYIEVEGCEIAGTVEDIQIVCTKLRTPDNKTIYVPNGTLSNSNIINYSEKDTRRVGFTFTISYDNDFEKAKAIIMDVCTSHDLVLPDPAPFVRLAEHGQSGLSITARVWVKSSDYWTVYFDILEAVKKSFDENGITIPYNQLDVHIKNEG